AIEAAFAHRMVAVIGAPDRLVRPHVDAVRAMEQPLAPRGEEIALAIEDDHRVGAAIEDVDAVAMIDGDPRDLLQRPAVGQPAPALRDAIEEATGPERHRHGMSSAKAPPAPQEQTLYQPCGRDNCRGSCRLSGDLAQIPGYVAARVVFHRRIRAGLVVARAHAELVLFDDALVRLARHCPQPG